MAKMTKEQALALSRSFRDASVQLGEYRFNNWATLKPSERATLEDEEWTLLNYSSDFITKAVGIALDDAGSDLKALMKAVDGAANVLRKIQIAKSAIELAGSLVVLGGAIASENPAAIATAAGDVFKAVQKIRKENAK